MANEQKVVYLPKMETRPGFKHSYQSSKDVKVVTVDPVKQRADLKASGNRRQRISGHTADDAGE